MGIKLKLKKWAYGDCKWYHFWRPQSGVKGGVIFGIIMFGSIGLLGLFGVVPYHVSMIAVILLCICVTFVVSRVIAQE